MDNKGILVTPNTADEEKADRNGETECEEEFLYDDVVTFRV